MHDNLGATSFYYRHLSLLLLLLWQLENHQPKDLEVLDSKDTYLSSYCFIHPFIYFIHSFIYFIHLFIYFIHHFIYSSIYLFYSSIYFIHHLFIHPFIYLFIYLFILFIHLFYSSFIYSSIYLFIHLGVLVDRSSKKSQRKNIMMKIMMTSLMMSGQNKTVKMILIQPRLERYTVHRIYAEYYNNYFRLKRILRGLLL